ncbi:exodeoxyribonuclease V alpha subunit [Pseudoalteromonas ulvae UL12]|uniref:exodeoxyribonuclease V subunit alpha n=1 Tax=Pseudoalteromonas ulvae TaxID=107327 RepID=UPI00186BA500|nr:exodeoxyribonuclease V subunit alpha [Pseudoalteromonas ulvae]MBE0363281.1 exodeoxyribonuclease V alpha subunit [Pseudoalteromonas ulvae UL12]
MFNQLLEQEKITPLDVELAQLLVRNESDPLFYIVLLLSNTNARQHTCLTLSEIDWHNPFNLSEPWSPFADTQSCINALMQHDAVGEDKPLRLVEERLYFARYADYEATLAQSLLAMTSRKIAIDKTALKTLLDQFFEPSAQIDWQKVACAMAVLNAFCVISGGPGTGKTTTVTKLLAILQSLYLSVPLSIKLVAPTGKAAARLSESIRDAKVKLGLSEQLANVIPEQAQTIHRLLGVIPQSNKYRHNKSNPLHLDVLIVDEASMVDLALMAKLVEALPSHARLILLGDKDQLTSVDTGNVLADICQDLQLGQPPAYSTEQVATLNQLCCQSGSEQLQSQPTTYKLADYIAFLQKSHRFNQHSGIGQLAKAVNSNDKALLAEIEKQGFAELTFYDLSTQYKAAIIRCAQAYSVYLDLIAQQAEPSAVHDAFLQYQLLAAVREGNYGVSKLNSEIEAQLARMGKITPSHRHYVGMPLMISQNDYQLQLFNGDIGIIMPDQEGQLKAVFMGERGQARYFYPARLPAHEKVYAMTIHKSQGSEFAHTVMMLPPQQQAKIGVNRQLVYTGITRAKQYFDLVAQPQVLKMAMSKALTRSSGLYQRLQQ